MNRLQNDVVLACSFKIKKGQNDAVLDPPNKKKLGLSPTLCNPMEEEGVRTWSEASQATASRLAGGERLARLSGAFVKGASLAFSLGAPFTTMDVRVCPYSLGVQSKGS